MTAEEPTSATARRPGPYGLNIFTGGRGPDRFRRTAALAVEAETAGFDGVWTGELYNRSATVPLTVLAQATSRVSVGSCIAYGVGRSPLVWAAEARDLDELSDGRLVLGLGNGNAAMMANWLSVSPDAPAERMRELVTVLRALWRLDEGPVRHEGRFYTVNLTPTAQTPPPVQARLPIWTAGIGPRLVGVAGAVSDGLVGHPMMTLQYLADVVRPALAAGASAAGRDPAEVAVAQTLMCSVDDDEDLARRRLAFAIAQYAPSKQYDPIFAAHGWTDVQLAVRAAAKARDTVGMVAALSDECLDAFGIACTPAGLPDRLAARVQAVDHVVLAAPVWGLSGDEAEDATRAVLDAVRPVLAARSATASATPSASRQPQGAA